MTAGIDPAILNGWNVRPGDWQIGASVQQQLLPRISVEAGYFRRWLTHFTTTDNTAVTAADYNSFSLNAPSDPRLPNGGGYPISGLFNVTSAGFARAPANNITFSDNFGGQTQVYNGVLVNVTARAANGLTLQGGINTGKTVNDYCNVRAQLPELSLGFGGSIVGPTNPYCLVDPGFVTKITGLGSYTVPKVDVLDCRHVPERSGRAAARDVERPGGAGRRLRWAVRQRSQAPRCRSTWSSQARCGAIASTSSNLRFAKVLRFGGTRTHVGFDVFNVLNSNAILTYAQTFIPNGAWLAPQSVMTPRFLKVSAQIDF